jgi:CDP-diacylglycerol--glycerol-3-phosphate 3-phosphatidyltransferase
MAKVAKKKPASKRAAKKAEKSAAQAQKKVHKETKKVAKKAVRATKKTEKRAARKVKAGQRSRIKELGIANCLTIFRIICIPFFILFFALEQYGLALITVGVAGFTDLIDGTVARMRKEMSALGAVLDPFADKGLMLATFIALAITGVVSWWFIYIILSRDILVLFGFFYVKFKKIPYQYKAIWSSKVATMFEIVTGTLALIYVTFPDAAISVYPLIDIVYGAVLVASVLILIATMQYLKLGLEILEKNPKHVPSHG